jgi:F-type H+-transporting ATPase subunit epsilon
LAETLHLEVVTPERRVVQEEVAELTAPGALGEFGVLSGHEPFVTEIEPGVLTYRSKESGETSRLAMSAGFAEIVEDKVTFLVDACEPAGEVDRARAEEARDRCLQKLKELPVDHADIPAARAALKRAEARMGASAA